MSKLLSIFKPPKKTFPADEMPVISVPDIKDYLVREYARVNELKRQNENLREQIDQCGELKIKYDAALVTLDEFSARLERAQVEMQKERARTENARRDADRCRELANSYKIQLNNAAVTKEQIREEIVSEVKAGIIERINSFKGNLSKKIVCSIISAEDNALPGAIIHQ